MTDTTAPVVRCAACGSRDVAPVMNCWLYIDCGDVRERSAPKPAADDDGFRVTKKVRADMLANCDRE